jgi:protein arginine N-methyltransferase 1
MLTKSLKSFPSLSVPISFDSLPSLFVSVGEYPVYDTECYHFMQGDVKITKAYCNALKNNVKNKNVLDVGTGQYMDWATIALDYGAAKATGLEVMPQTYLKALSITQEARYKNKLKLVNLISTKYKTKEKFDVCVSEIIGTIGSSEGVINALNDVRKRLLIPEGVMIPYSCQTLVGAIGLRNLNPNPQFHASAYKYIDQIFQWNKKPFDLRITLEKNHPSAIMSTTDIVENLNFSNLIKSSEKKECLLTITKNGVIDGLLFWINLFVEKEGIKIDSLRQKSAWETVYFPLFDELIEVKKGDQIYLTFQRKLSDDKLHPDYFIKASLITKKKTYKGQFKSYHHGNIFHSNKLYKELFS